MSEIINGEIYLSRKDLNLKYKFTEIENIKLPMFIKDFHMFLSSKKIIFTDDDGIELLMK